MKDLTNKPAEGCVEKTEPESADDAPKPSKLLYED